MSVERIKDMKYKVLYFICGIIFTLFTTSISFAIVNYNAAVSDFKIYLNEQPFVTDTPPVIIEDRTYLPVRALAEALELKVNWNADKKEIKLESDTWTPVLALYENMNYVPDYGVYTNSDIKKEEREVLDNSVTVQYSYSSLNKNRYINALNAYGFKDYNNLFPASKNDTNIQTYVMDNEFVSIWNDKTYLYVNYKSQNRRQINQYDFTKDTEILAYLIDYYSSMKSSIGWLYFNYYIVRIQPNTYYIRTGYDQTVNAVLNDNVYTDEQIENIKKELKNFQRDIGESLIEKLPGVKLWGGYYRKEQDKDICFYCWGNFNKDNADNNFSSQFRWLPNSNTIIF